MQNQQWTPKQCTRAVRTECKLECDQWKKRTDANGTRTEMLKSVVCICTFISDVNIDGKSSVFAFISSMSSDHLSPSLSLSSHIQMQTNWLVLFSFRQINIHHTNTMSKAFNLTVGRWCYWNGLCFAFYIFGHAIDLLTFIAIFWKIPRHSDECNLVVLSDINEPVEKDRTSKIKKIKKKTNEIK